MFDLSKFISEYVTKRPVSMFYEDIQNNREELTRKIKDKTVLVIGGAGSIGSSYIKAILPFEPKTLVVVDINENGLAELTRDLRSTKGMFVPEDYIPYPMDFASPTFEKMFRARAGFDIVANFSAHKHVRSEKDIFSVEALIKNNVLHAKKLLDLLAEFPPEEYFCVSTDKAANPVNIMGASKRIMEDVIFSLPGEYSEYAKTINVPSANPYEEKNKLWGGAMLIKRHVFNEVGPMDENFSPGYFEDDDFSMRIHAAGYRLVACHNSFIYHAGSQSFIKRDDLREIFARNRSYMTQLWGYDNPTYSPMSEQENDALKLISHGKDDFFRFLEIGAGNGNQ